MGLFSKIFKSGKAEGRQADRGIQDFSYVSEIAGLITNNDTKIMKNISLLINNPEEYEKSWEMGGLKADDKDFFWLCMVDELSEYGYLFSVDYKCELEDFLWALSQINNYSLIESVVSGLTLDETKTPDAWGEEINLALNGKAFACAIDIDSDSYELIIVPADVYEKISSIAEANGHSIEDF